MDNHFEVILERLKQLTEQTGVVVWFEIPDEVSGDPAMVLISQSNKIGMIQVKYSDLLKLPQLVSYKLTKPMYDKLIESEFNLDKLEIKTKPIDTAKLLKWVAEV
jgi:hypothetical protein